MTGPVEFSREVLGRDLWSVQESICDSVRTKPHTSVKGCHASGKTFVAAGLALWWLIVYHRVGGLVLTVSPTLRQVKTFWREIHQAIKDARFPLWLNPQTTQLEITKNNFAMGFSASKGVNVQGFHGAKGLLIVDESPGVIAEVWEAIDGITAGGDWTQLRMGNPTIPSGPFFDDFGRNRLTVNGVTISAFDSPNLQGLTIDDVISMNDEDLRHSIKIPSLVRPAWVRDMYRKWGPDSPQYQSRVLGNFPPQSRYSVFPADAVALANRALTPEQTEELKQLRREIQVGVDVAGAGDDETAACARTGNVVIAADAWADADASPHLLRFLGDLRRHYPHAKLTVVVDIIGVGYHLATRISAEGYDVRGFVANGHAADSVTFHDAKAEAYWCLREWMKRGIYGVTDPDVQGQLIGIQYQVLHSQQVKIEEKEAMKKRGLSSPDRAEALVMAFAPLIPLRQMIQTTETGELLVIPR